MSKSTKTYSVTFGAPPKKKYGFFHLCWDFFLVMITGGLWLIWIFIRYLRSNTH